MVVRLRSLSRREFSSCAAAFPSRALVCFGDELLRGGLAVSFVTCPSLAHSSTRDGFWHPRPVGRQTMMGSAMGLLRVALDERRK